VRGVSDVHVLLQIARAPAWSSAGGRRTSGGGGNQMWQRQCEPWGIRCGGGNVSTDVHATRFGLHAIEHAGPQWESGRGGQVKSDVAEAV
jgi:hypothetical protein